MEKVDTSLMLDFYENLYKTRRFEEELFEYYKSGKMPGMVHLSNGQEAVGTAAVKAFQPQDFIGLHHRSHAHFFMRGCDMGELLAEVLGKKGGMCKGKGGTIHCADFSRLAVGLTGILGSNFTICTGVAYHYKMMGNDAVAVVFTGDGATNEGAFHESLNMAAAWKLPLVVVIENNLYGISTDIRAVTGLDCLSTRAKGYGIPGTTVDGNDVEATYRAVKEAADYARAGNGPSIVECMTYRTKGHHVGDPGKYKDPDEQAHWKTRDPIEMLEKRLYEEYGVGGDELAQIREKCERDIQAAKDYADNSPYPDIYEAYSDLYSNGFNAGGE